MITHVTLTCQTETNGRLCLCVYMLVHSPSYQQVSHTGLVVTNLLSKQEKSEILNAAITIQKKKKEEEEAAQIHAEG